MRSGALDLTVFGRALVLASCLQDFPPPPSPPKPCPVRVLLSVHRARLIILVSSDTFKSAASAAWGSRARRQALSISNVGRRMWYSTVAALYTSVCKSVRLDPHTAPFSYDRFKGFCVPKIFTSPTANLRTATKENWIGSEIDSCTLLAVPYTQKPSHCTMRWVFLLLKLNTTPHQPLIGRAERHESPRLPIKGIMMQPIPDFVHFSPPG